MRKKIVRLEELSDILTPQQVADYLGISRRGIYEFCLLNPTDGGLPSFTVGASRKIKKTSLIDWIEMRFNQEKSRKPDPK